jgi:hypothetical protein
VENLSSGIEISPEDMAKAYVCQMENWQVREPRPDLLDFFRSAGRATLRLLTPSEFWCLVWDYWPDRREPHELMTAGGTRRLLRNVAEVYLRETASGYQQPGFTDRVEDLRNKIAAGHRPDPVFLAPTREDVPGGSFWMADGVGRMTALATVALEAGLEPTPVAMIANF